MVVGINAVMLLGGSRCHIQGGLMDLLFSAVEIVSLVLMLSGNHDRHFNNSDGMNKKRKMIPY
jgi:hypothetical protein